MTLLAKNWKTISGSRCTGLATNKIITKKMNVFVMKAEIESFTLPEAVSAEIIKRLMPEDSLSSDNRKTTQLGESWSESTVSGQKPQFNRNQTQLAPVLDQIDANIWIAASLEITIQREGKLVTIMKAADKDPSYPKSLRPITFLRELGKLL